MAACAGIRSTEHALESLRSLDLRTLPAMQRTELARLLESVTSSLVRGDPAEAAAVANAALRACQMLHTASRSREALALAREVLGFSKATGDETLKGRALSTCGILCADLGDPVGAIDYQVDALRMAGDDRLAAARAWGNIGLAMSVAGHTAMAARCYERALAVMEGGAGSVDSRYTALTNLAQFQFETGDYEDGLVSAYLALSAEGSMLQRDAMMVLRLRRNFVRLLVAVGRAEDAEPHVIDATLLAQRIGTPRAMIAASLASAVYELALGHADVGLTRLDTALAQAREMPGLLRDTLASVVRAEEMAGHSERALMRLRELCDVMHGAAVTAARQHIELASLADREQAGGAHAHAQVRARLVSKLDSPRQPDGWTALDRLGITASVRMEPSGLHGKRVGALAKALALADGVEPLQALEIGFACELHDIGMVSVPEELLSRRPLSAELEHTIIDRHVRAGAEILADDQHPRIFLAREVVRYHHAHWDGSGRPSRVAGTRIPYAARICAIADAYDDLVCGTRGTHRRTMGQALGQLRGHAGRAYDPHLVERFETMIRSETSDLGLDMTAPSGMDNFQQLVRALQEDRGFV